MDFCQKLLQLRSEKKVTQEVVATACGMTLRQYHRSEKDEQKLGFDNLRNMVDSHGMSVDWLMGRIERWEVWR